MSQPAPVPNLEAQRAAMRKLNFLVGDWAGEASALRGPLLWVELAQTEEVRYKLDGLILVIEGVGRTKPEGKPVLQALGIISYDDVSSRYHMRAFNDGRFLETEIKLQEAGEGMTWGFVLGEIRTSSVMRINDKGEWTELHEITMGSQPPKELMQVVVRRQK